MYMSKSMQIKMGNFNKKRFGGSRDNNRRSGNGGSGRGANSDRQMYRAVCSECGKDCEIPFRPSGGKPVFCRDCFKKEDSRDQWNASREGGEWRRNDRSLSRPRFGNGDRSQRFERRPSSDTGDKFDVLNAKLDKIIKLLHAMDPQEIKKGPRDKKAEKMLSRKVDANALKEVITEAFKEDVAGTKKPKKTTAKKATKKPAKKTAKKPSKKTTDKKAARK
jgi:CxxC-x17-CxxC domain-containing protein